MKIRGILAGLGVVILAGCSGEGGSPTVATSAAPETFTFAGELLLTSDVPTTGRSCQGRGGYSDIAEGAPVTVYGKSGEIIALGNLSLGESTSLGCKFQFFVGGVPTGEGFYQYEVSHRGKLSISEADAVAGNASASLGR